MPCTLTLSRRELLAAVKLAAKVATKRHSLPVLSHVLLRGQPLPHGARLTVAATDLETWLEVRVGATPEGSASLAPSSVAIPAKALADALAKRTLATVTLTLEPSRLTLSGGATQTLAGIDASEFPCAPDPAERSASAPAGKLAEALARVAYAASRNVTRYNLNAVLFEVPADGGALRLVATDGHHLALAECAHDGEPMAERARDWERPVPELGTVSKPLGVPREALLPLAAVTSLEALLKRAVRDLPVRFGFGRDRATFEVPGARLTAQLTDGEFPNYRQVIPRADGDSRAVTVYGPQLAEALTSLLPVLSATREFPVRLTVSEHGIDVEAKTPDAEASAHVPCDFAGPAISTGFNARYLLAALGTVGKADVELRWLDAEKPWRLTPCDVAGAFAIVMPMRL